ncbi:hypothetical protein LADH09A_001802 [Micromonospora sp. LAH09]|uniref:hypothetical protein n=1 Tax=Micromonospora cabrerizensis TaxID=2911213 RepID=UPI001EE7B074|nr:hypothetical protein [Micromonospora cabrerizensis]MCG5467952.1 hypothetical protein [Micromonospora cabrerizensis]
MKLISLIRAGERQFLLGAVMWIVGAPLMLCALWRGMPTLYLVGLAPMAVGTGMVAKSLRQATSRPAACDRRTR